MKYYRTVHVPLRQRLSELRQGPLIVMVWLAAIGVTGWILAQQKGQLEFVGLAQPLNYEVSTPTPGQLATLTVELYQSVQAGEVIGRLDDSGLTAQLKTASMGVERLRAELDAEQAKLQAEQQTVEYDWQAQLRRFQSDEEQRNLQALSVKVDLESDRVEEQRLASELERQKKLVEADVISRNALDNLQHDHDRMAQKVKESARLLEQTEEATAIAKTRREEFVRQTPAAAKLESQLHPLSAAIKEQEAAVAEIEQLRQGLVLHAPATGQVTQVLCRPGQAVVSGEPVVIVTPPQAQEVVAYVNEVAFDQIRPNMPVNITRLADPQHIGHSSVTRIGPAVEQIPLQLWRSPQTPEFGRPVMISVVPELGIVPGESIRVEFQTPHAAKFRPMLAFLRPKEK